MEVIAHLQVTNGAGVQTVREIDKPTLILGRNPDCDITINNLDASRQHARILTVQGEFFLEDLRSTNGTFLNDQPVYDRKKIVEGDRIRVSDTICEFHEGITPEPASIGPPRPTVAVNEEELGKKLVDLSQRDEPIEKRADRSFLTFQAEQKIESTSDFPDRLRQGILPAEVPVLPGYEFFQFFVPAPVAGGDFYDYVPMYNGHLMVFMADTTTHGAAAAMLTARLAVEIRASLLISSTLSDTMRNLNQSLFRHLPHDHFIKMAVAELVPENGEVTLVSAGHQQPLLRGRDGRVSLLGNGQAGLPLGVADDADYSEISFEIPFGGTLILHNDGAVQATASSGQVYGQERIRSQAANTRGGPAEIGGQLEVDMRQFIAGAEQTSDICIVCFGRE